ncbi:MAG TPA: molybdenum cofactor biosynthesis protein MoaE [Patescibacteria group bacterium]|nr:molybdenum cofactor biosynthesis protein MoaE [Patescibacteria group bacterium]
MSRGASSFFRLNDHGIDVAGLRRALDDRHCGAVVGFDGIVRDHHGGRAVSELRYEAYAELAEREGQVIVEEARAKFAVRRIVAEHRVGLLAIGEIAVYVGVAAAHRDAAFSACRYVIDEIKARVPIWKHEHYADGAAEWIHPD